MQYIIQITSKTPVKNIKMSSYCINIVDWATMLDLNFQEKPHYSKVKNVTISKIILKFKCIIFQNNNSLF